MADEIYTCKYCGEEIPKSTKKCFHCGATLKTSIWHKLLMGIGIVCSFCFFNYFFEGLIPRFINSFKTSNEPAMYSKSTETEQYPPIEIDQTDWNISDLNALKNGNIQLALDKIKSSGDLREEAIDVVPGLVFKQPWKYYGKVIKIHGWISNIQDYPPGSSSAELMGGKASEMNIVSGGIIVDFFYPDTSDDLVGGNWITIYGYPVGQAELENQAGGKTTVLVIVGNAFDQGKN